MKNQTGNIISVVAVSALLTLAIYPLYRFTLEDTWIFLALGSHFSESQSLYGATSLTWGLFSVWVANYLPLLAQLNAVKGASLILYVSGFIVTAQATCEEVEDKRSIFVVACLFALMPFNIWAASGMDTSLSVLWVALVLSFLAKFLRTSDLSFAYLSVVTAGVAYLIRPEMLWLPFAVVFFISLQGLPGKWTLVLRLSGIAFSELFLSLFIYWCMTGHIKPSSSIKVVGISFVSLISTAWFLVVVSPIALAVYFRRNSINRFGILYSLMAVILIRLTQHAVMGGIDHRTLSSLLPAIAMIGGVLLYNLKFRRNVFLLMWFAALYILTLLNARWYWERTEEVHFKSLKYIEDNYISPTVGTEEVGILSFRFGVNNVFDFHGLLPKKLDESARPDLLIFTGDLFADKAAKWGYIKNQTFCYAHSKTIYTRTVGFTPQLYCKTLYSK